MKYNINNLQWFFDEYKKLDEKLENAVIELIKANSKTSIIFDKLPTIFSPLEQPNRYKQLKMQVLVIEDDGVEICYIENNVQRVNKFKNLNVSERIAIYNFLYQLRAGVINWKITEK